MTIQLKRPISEISPPLSEAFKLLLETPMKLDRNRSVVAINFLFKQEKKKRVYTNASHKKPRAYDQKVYLN